MGFRSHTTKIKDETGVTASFNTDALDISHRDGVNIHAIWTKESGTLAGTIDIQASNDDTNWIAILDSSGSAVQQTITDASGEYMFNIADLYSKYLRVAVVITGGTATYEITATQKGGT